MLFKLQVTESVLYPLAILEFAKLVGWDRLKVIDSFDLEHNPELVLKDFEKFLSLQPSDKQYIQPRLDRYKDPSRNQTIDIREDTRILLERLNKLSNEVCYVDTDTASLLIVN